jgi:polyhydroxyalkanoate synthase
VWKDSATWDIVKEWSMRQLLHPPDVQDYGRSSGHAGLACRARIPKQGVSPPRRVLVAQMAQRAWRRPISFWTNPVAMRMAHRDQRRKPVRGMRNFLEDLRGRQCAHDGSRTTSGGKNLATTPGKVVFRNRLLEVIHYAPTTGEGACKMPIVIVTPWINKFYILDLNPKKSMVRYLLARASRSSSPAGRIPMPEMRDVRFDDYLSRGASRPSWIRRAGFCGCRQVHAAATASAARR